MYITDDGISFWALSVDGGEKYYLGMLKGDDIVWNPKLYSFPWDVYRSAERLFKEVLGSKYVKPTEHLTDTEKSGFLYKLLHLH